MSHLASLALLVLAGRNALRAAATERGSAFVWWAALTMLGCVGVAW